MFDRNSIVDKHKTCKF